MKPINVCITVFNRYDLLSKLIDSVRKSDVAPGRVVKTYIIDRGNDRDRLRAALDGHPAVNVRLKGQSLPEAWNWFMENVIEERILVSDDVVFFPDALESFAAHKASFVGLNDNGRSSHFACFMVRDACIRKVGYFDERISPNYMYFEDCDYAYRMKLAGVPLEGLSCMHHGLAQSWEQKTDAQKADHHERFVIAQNNYIRKWGGLPGQEVYTTPFNSMVGV